MGADYTPTTDLAFKNRITNRYGASVTEQILVRVLNTIEDEDLNNGEQRVVLPDAMLLSLEYNPEDDVLIGVVLNGATIQKENIDAIVNVGRFNGFDVWAMHLQYSSFAVGEFSKPNLEAVYDAPIEFPEGD